MGIDDGKMTFIGAVENIFKDAYNHHEISLVFETEVNDDIFKSKEDHLEFELLSMDKFRSADVLPVSMKESVYEWLEDREKFWRSE